MHHSGSGGGRPRHLVIVVVVAVVAASSAAAAEPAATAPVTAWLGGSIAESIPQHAVASGAGALSFGLLPWLEPEAMAAIGLRLTTTTGALAMVDAFRFGVRLALPLDGIRPFVGLGIHHRHAAALDVVARDPLPTILGFSNTGVLHRTGAEVSLGATVPIVVDTTAFALMGRVGVAALPALESTGGHSHGSAAGEVIVGLEVAAGLPLVGLF